MHGSVPSSLGPWTQLSGPQCDRLVSRRRMGGGGGLARPRPACSMRSNQYLCKCPQLGKMRPSADLGEGPGGGTERPAEGAAWWPRSGKGGGGSQGAWREPFVSLGPPLGDKLLLPLKSSLWASYTPPPPATRPAVGAPWSARGLAKVPGWRRAPASVPQRLRSLPHGQRQRDNDVPLGTEPGRG